MEHENRKINGGKKGKGGKTLYLYHIRLHIKYKNNVQTMIELEGGWGEKRRKLTH